MKRLLLVVCLMAVISVFVIYPYNFSNPQIGIIDEAKTVELDEVYDAFYFSVRTTPFSNIFLPDKNEPIIVVPPVYVDGVLSLSYGLIPVGVMGYVTRFSFWKDLEVSLGFNWETPSFAEGNYFFASIMGSVGVKKRHRVNMLNISYKIDLSVFYNGKMRPGGGLKGSLLIGTDNKSINHNGIFALETLLSADGATIFDTSYGSVGTFDLILLTNIIGEYTLSYRAPNRFKFLFSFYAQYSICFDISQLYSQRFYEHDEYHDNLYSYHFNGLNVYNKIYAALDIGVKFCWGVVHPRFTFKKINIPW